MEYLTIEEKASLIGYLVLLEERIKSCKSLGISYEHWENLQPIAIKAIDKIKKQDSLEVIEMRKQVEECKH